MAADDVTLPRKFHWIWLGSNPLPAEYRDWMDGWLRLHPGWEGHVWTDSNLPPLQNDACFQAAKSMAQRADIARYEIVFQQGGVYIDTDFECLRNITPLLAGKSAFVGEEEDGHIANSIFGAVPKHPWLERAIERLPLKFRTETTIVEQTGPNFLDGVTRGRDDVHVFAPEIFFPYTWRQRHQSAQSFPRAYAIHHWAHSWAGGDGTDQRAARATLKAQVEEAIPPGERFLMLSSEFPVELAGNRRPVSLLGLSTLDGGLPADDAQAIEAVRCGHRQGLRYIVLEASTVWWRAHYLGLHRFLIENSEATAELSQATVFRLAADELRNAAP